MVFIETLEASVTIYSIDINESLVTNVTAAKTYTKYVKESRRNEKER